MGVADNAPPLVLRRVKLGVQFLVNRQDGGAKPLAKQGKRNNLRTYARFPVVQKNTVAAVIITALFFNKGVYPAALRRR